MIDDVRWQMSDLIFNDNFLKQIRHLPSDIIHFSYSPVTLIILPGPSTEM